jgi:N-acetylneuraminic acid mutarotase
MVSTGEDIVSQRWKAGVLGLLCGAVCGGSCGTSPSSPADDGSGWWAQAAAFGGPAIRGSVGFAVGGSGYVVSGLVDGVGLVAATWRYDAATDHWSHVADFPGTPRLDGSAFAVGGKGYVLLGSDNNVMLADVWEYDPTVDAWTRKADFPGGPLMLASTVVISGTAYVITGQAAAGATNGVWAYDPSADAWTPRASFPGGSRSAGVALAIGGRGYFGLGNAPGGGTMWNLRQDFWEYDPQTDQWARRADLPAAGRGYALGLGLGTRGFVTQGVLAVNAGGASLVLANDLWEYAPAGDAWTRRADLPGSARGMAVSFVIGASGYVGVGNDQQVVNLRDFWRLTPP